MLGYCWIVIVVFVVVWGQRVPENPCPDIFTYKQDRGGVYGEIAIPYDGSKSLNLAVNISMVGLYQNMKLKLDLLTPADRILNTPVVHYRVNFPFQNIVPRITQITYNDRVFCYGPSEPVSTRGVTNLWANIVYKINQYSFNLDTNPYISNNIQPQPVDISPPVIQPPATSPPVEPQPPVTSCGTANDIQTLVLKGEKTIDNEYPWLTAMFHRQGVSYEFQCTANLISTQHVVTAAHCVWFYKAPLISKEDILLVLGRSDISHWASTGALIRTALDVVPHPNYKQGSGHCDVAIIKMNEEVTFRPTVRPVCLWEGETETKAIAGTDGMVAGWGKSEKNQKVVAEPRKVSMPVVSQDTCLYSHADFKNLTSEMTFCAGKRDGSGPCSGDSGAGFVVKKAGKWYLRGLVSTAIKNEDFSCNLNEFIVFADVAKLGQWIRTIIK